MKKSLPLLCVFLLLSLSLSAQKVGVVLSGGGAKGMTHIGVIRALEEHNIPIDYITGTSMGAIIGSLYAMGYSPDDMEELLRSEEFNRWYSGEVEGKYMYYFKKNKPTPEFINMRFSFKDSLQVKPKLLPTNVVNPIQMNLAFVDLYARATAACEGNFDQLFVPFRCVASDVYNKRQLVLKSGDLGDAVRASMSFPFMFKPIELDGVLAYDGGIYNNFPTDVMRDDFHPDLIIGSVVASNPTRPEEHDLMSQIENMVMQKTDYSLPDSAGIVLTFKFNDVGLLDFQRLSEFSELGYKRTNDMMDSIKARVNRRVNKDNVRLRRLVHRSNYPELRFKKIYIVGANEEQKAYMRKEFQVSEEQEFGFEELKKGYFRLLSDDMFAEIIPHAIYNAESDLYDLHLNVKLKNNLAVRMGGSLSTTSSGQIYLGLSYQDLNYYSKELSLDGQFGKVYNNAQLMAKIDFATTIPTSYRFIASLSTFDYFKKDRLFSGNDTPAFNQKEERFVKLLLALPFRSTKRAEFGVGLGQLKDRYFQKNVIDFNNDAYDNSRYQLFGGSISFNGSTLNARQYATTGTRESLTAEIFTGREYFSPGVTTGGEEGLQKSHSWLQFSYTKENYHRVANRWVLGWYLEALYASRNFSTNYAATMMQAGEFSPTAHSRLNYNEAFRANQFVAAGVRPIYRLNQMFHLRSELYGFMPIVPIEKGANNRAYSGTAFSRFEYLGELSLVCQLPFGAMSAYLNYYSSPKREWNVGITLGWQLFNYRFIE